MELNVTKAIQAWQDDDSGLGAMDYSASVAEIGNDAGASTWRNAKEDAGDYFDMTEDEIEGCKQWFGEFGAWSKEEITAWDSQETHALLLQFLAGDYREYESFDSYEEYEQAGQEGSVSSRLFRGDDKQWYLYVGN